MNGAEGAAVSSFASAVQSKMKSAKMPIKKLAAKAGIDTNWARMIVAGRPVTLRTMVRMATALGCTLSIGLK